MADIAQNVATQVADIIRRVGKREEIEDQVAENIDFSELVSEMSKTEGPVKDALVKLVLQFLKGYDIGTETDEAITILEAVDFAEVVKKMQGDEDFQAAISASIKSSLEGLSEMDSFTEAVDEVFCLNDSEKLAKRLTPKTIEELEGIIIKAIKSHLEDIDVTNLGDDVQQAIEEAVFTKERVQACFKRREEDIDDLVVGAVKALMEGEDSYGDSPLGQVILESEALKTAVDSAIKGLISSGKITKLVEESAESLLTDGDSSLRHKLTSAISDKLVGKVAESITERMFDTRK